MSGQEVLSIRVGLSHLSFCTTNKAGTELYQLVYTEPATKQGQGWKEESLAELINTYPALKKSYYQVLVAYDYPQSVLMPSQQYRLEEGNNLVSSLYGRAAAAVTVAEPVTAWQLTNVYSVPVTIQEWITRHFPAASIQHQYSVGLKYIIGGKEEGSIAIDIRKDDFTVLVAKQGKFLLAQTCEYATPEDILYYLLKIVSAFSLSQRETGLFISGLVDRQSALYKELYQYFINIEFRDATWNAGEYPIHFFTSLNDLARCAS